MSLIKSISGIRGTIGGSASEGLNPINIVNFTAAFATQARKNSPVQSNKIVVGRDARMSGDMIQRIVIGTLQAVGFDVVNIGLATTPTTEFAVTEEGADAGIIITASHNPKHWNALKLLNHAGTFLSDAEGREVYRMADAEDFTFAEVDHLGHVEHKDYTDAHVQMVLSLPEVDAAAIREAGLTVCADTINSVGGIALPRLFDALGVKSAYLLHGEPTGDFAHNPEPLPQNLVELGQLVKEKKADVGFSVDPDVDRLAIFCEDGTPFGEEYTLVSIADYLLSLYPGSDTVSNLSSTRALRDVTISHGGTYTPAAVGEVNVVTKMKEVGALIGGEGNGGVIYPEAHYGRDALVGIALFLTMMAKRFLKPTQIKALLPQYAMVKKRQDLTGLDVERIFDDIKRAYKNQSITTIDGVKIDFADRWVHLRKSNTEPIMRIYAEAPTEAEADAIAEEVISHFAPHETNLDAYK